MFRPNWTLLAIIFVVFICLQLIITLVFPREQDCSRCRMTEGAKFERAIEKPQQSAQRDSTRMGRFIIQDPNERAKAAIVVLARNSDIEGLQKSIGQLEQRFNKKFGYPYVFLNDVPFNDHFKEEMRKLSANPMEFGTIPVDHWSYPAHIDVKKADEARQSMSARRIIYGGSLPYRHMCRFNSGFFFRHPLLDKYEYYWRVEPHVEFYCDLDRDPFMFMKRNNKKYGFTIMLHEYMETIPTLWETTMRFVKENPDVLHENNAMSVIVEDGDRYNGCHFWSNFEIAELAFFRSAKYLRYFDYLDRAGGFFYERWGDAPVHSNAVMLFLDKSQIHYFEEIGYYHGPFTNCPMSPDLHKKCQCDQGKNVNKDHACFKRYVRMLSENKP